GAHAERHSFPTRRSSDLTEQLALIGELSQTYARNTADITDRQNVQYHWIRIEDVPTIWARLEAAGLTTLEACGDSPRVILGSPVDRKSTRLNSSHVKISY